MSKLKPNDYYPTLELTWGREEYRHRIGFNLMYPDFLMTKIIYKGLEIPQPPYLYKYFRPNENSLETLKKNYLYFSNPKDFGDEYDCLISDNESINHIIEDSKDIIEKLGVCCFCTIPDEDRMWDFYAGGFKGFVLKFKNNAQFLPYGKESTIKSHMMYLNDNGSNNPNLIETIKSMEGKHFPNVVESWQKQILYHHELCRKRIIYDFEKEYRAISFFASEFDRKIPIPKENIDSIYIGNKIKKEYLVELVKILEENKNIKIMTVTHDYKKQKIKFSRAKSIKSLKKEILE
jgi:hypothetical protein